MVLVPLRIPRRAPTRGSTAGTAAAAAAGIITGLVTWAILSDGSTPPTQTPDGGVTSSPSGESTGKPTPL